MIGEFISAYRIVRKLGEGGMGAVYEAIHEQIGRRAAIKVLAPQLWDEDEDQHIERLFNEARAANIIQHPGVVSIYEFGYSHDKPPAKQAYIIMELLEGESLGTRLRRHPSLPTDFVLYLVRQIASTLTVVHQKGIYHRDLKPDNVMLVPDSEVPFGERSKLVDFGIAKLTEAAGAEGPGLVRTRTGVAIGSPLYMSPEQCAGARSIDGKSDVYSLGVIFFQMLAHKTPFVAKTAADLITMHLHEPPPMLRTLVPEISSGIDQLVASLLHKEPGQRPTMAQMVEALEKLGAAPAHTMSTAVGSPDSSTPQPNIDPTGENTSGVTSPALFAPESSGKSSGVSLPAAQSATERPAPRRVFLSATYLGIALGAGAVLTEVAHRIHPKPLVAPASSPPVTQLQAPSQKPIPVWSIITTPEGASVVRKSDGVVLGQTPWKTDAPAEPSGTITLVLRLKGYEDYPIVLSHGIDSLIDKQLTVRVEPAAVLQTQTAAAAAAKPARPGRPARSKSRSAAAAASKDKDAPSAKDSAPVISEPEEFKRSGGLRPSEGR